MLMNGGKVEGRLGRDSKVSRREQKRVLLRI